jgi:predicted kinase
MHAVIFCGMQATGKSSFYRERFFRTHVRLSLDLLRTRHRERLLLQACLEARQPFVIDNTNPTRQDRARYVEPARAAGFRVIGYYFDSPVEAALRRNAARAPSERVPIAGIRGTHKRLEPPTLAEGFDELFCVTIGGSGGFLAREWCGALA